MKIRIVNNCIGWALLFGLIIWGLIILAVLSCSCANDIVSWSHSTASNDRALTFMDSVKNNLKTTVDVEELMKLYKPSKQRFWWNYTPKIETVFKEGLEGNCQFAAVLGKWALEIIGIPARGVTIWRNKDYHAIAVSEDNRIFISNNDMIFLPATDDYKKTILNSFEPPYVNWHEGILKEI